MNTNDIPFDDPTPVQETVQDAGQIVDGEKVSFAGVIKSFRSFSLSKTLSAENIFANMRFIFFLVGLAVVYIYNTHLVETTTREIDKVKADMKEYRWKYMSAKSSLMFNSKQTEVASAVESQGLKELRVPPKKIVVKQGEY